MSLHLAEKSLLAATEALGGAVKERVTGLLRGLAIVVASHGASACVLNSMLTQFVVFLNVEQESVFLKRSKWLLAAPMAKFLRCAEPETQDRVVYHGAWKRWAKSRLIAYNRTNVHLWFSFMQCKRSAVPLSPGIVYETYLKHRAQMLRQDPLQGESGDALYERVVKLLQPVLAKIKAGLARVLDRELYSLDHKASENASWESGRSSGGQAGTLNNRLYESVFGRSKPAFVRESDDLVRIKWAPLGFRTVTKSTAGRDPVRVTVGSLAQGEMTVDRTDLQLREEWRNRIRSWAIADVDSYHGRLPAMIQAVLEPLKVRVISKGPSAPYYFAKGLQSALHGIMRKMPCFRLIGRPVCPTDLYDLDRGGDATLWFSGDYEASTDNLSARLGNGLFAQLIDELDDHDIEVYKAVLAPHMCHYPPVKGFDPIEPVEQANGQLMGSVLSFPILCLANLGLYLATVLEGRADPTPKEIFDACDKVLVNGDDILYRCSEQEAVRHEALGKAVGLKMSVGKSYVHPRYANVNSTSFDFMLGEKVFQAGGPSPRQIDFLNTGLFFGQHKVLGRVGIDVENEEVAPQPLSAVIDTLLQGAGPIGQPRLLAAYLRQHAEGLTKECQGRNLFIARSLGGMGVALPVGFRTDFTWLQKAIAKLQYDATSSRCVKISPYNFRVVRRPVLEAKAWAILCKEPDLYRDPAPRHGQQRQLARRKTRFLSETVMQLGIVTVAPSPYSRPVFD